MKQSVLERFIAILRGDPFLVKSEIDKDSKFSEFEGWDSYKHLAFLIEIEKQFSLTLEPKQMAEMTRLSDFLELVAT